MSPAPLSTAPSNTGRRAIACEQIVTPEGIVDGYVILEGETIAEICTELTHDLPVEDLGSLALLPGLVDCHVHINEPGRTEWEGFSTATEAAAAGGVTTLVDMPLNCIPVTTSAAALATKLESTRGSLHVDAGFWGGVVPGNIEALSALAAGGVLGCKAFLCHSGIDDFPNVEEAQLRQAMRVLREAEIPLLAHAELDLGHPPCPAGDRSHDAWLRSRPRAWEDAAIALLIALCRETGCAVHIVHLSSASALPQLRAARAEGLPLTVETCPHYLCLAAEDIPEGATFYKCAPPIRERENQDKLWEALEEGLIDFVISDHSPCTPALKRLEDGDFGNAWGGIASLSLGLRSIWTHARQRGASLNDLATWMSERPAQFAGVSRTKGSISVGKHADFVAFDPNAEMTIDESQLYFRHRVSPYLGQVVRGEIRQTWLRGERVFEERAILGAPRGQVILGRDGSALR